MRREILYAIGAGVSLGLIIAFGIWRVNSAVNVKRTPSASATPMPTAEFGITLAKPENESVIIQNPVTISGITKPGIWVVISTDTKDYLVQAASDGTFTKDINLVSGINQIKVSSLDVSDGTAQANLILVYSTEFGKISSLPPSSTPSSSTQESEIREKVQKKVEEALNNPKAYLGVVTDIVESTLQIKGASGEIKQASVDPKDVTVIKDGKVVKEVKFTDIAIGDFIVAMGYKNGNGVLDTKRILITTQPDELKIKAVLGKITDIGKANVTILQPKDNRELSVAAAKDSKVKLSSLDEGDIVIFVGTLLADGTFSARTLFNVTPSPTATPK